MMQNGEKKGDYDKGVLFAIMILAAALRLVRLADLPGGGTA